jgi:hypothetical protein
MQTKIRRCLMSAVDGQTRTALAVERKRIAPAGAPLFVVRIVERCEPRLTGREELGCEVPPQTLPAAQTLVCLLMRRGHPREIVEGSYRVAVAGGQQLITLEALR